MTDKTPICADCEHYGCRDINWPTRFMGCCREEAKVGQKNPVDGRQKWRSTNSMREPGSPCGPEGKLYEQAALPWEAIVLVLCCVALFCWAVC